jgi:hypothetical protein
MFPACRRLMVAIILPGAILLLVTVHVACLRYGGLRHKARPDLTVATTPKNFTLFRELLKLFAYSISVRCCLDCLSLFLRLDKQEFFWIESDVGRRVGICYPKEGRCVKRRQPKGEVKRLWTIVVDVEENEGE